ncbi:hypothetical protein AVEN_62030-1 [Araneus ventricosus]|uniref:Uncharacterized protein n=1 Tax=Araneus ventricosus TaxID=182803 RepID=A0A4Y2LGP3_ARAVE|nr:hypothetical protein AVEN_62030-1 [Araneus ventricosus]
MRLIYLSCSKWCPSATTHIWTRDCTSRCTLHNMTGGTLVQASIMRFRSTCNIGGGIEYTRCLMYPHRNKSNGFRSGERGGYSTQPPYPMTCCWNVSRMYCSTLDTLCGGASSCSVADFDDMRPQAQNDFEAPLPRKFY